MEANDIKYDETTIITNFNDEPFVIEYEDYSQFTNIIFIDDHITDSNLFLNSLNNNTLPILYNYNTDKDKILTYLKTNVNSIDRLCFVFDNSQLNYKLFLNNETFFTENDLSQNSDILNDNDYSKNLLFIINLVTILNIKRIDFLACNLLKCVSPHHE